MHTFLLSLLITLSSSCLFGMDSEQTHGANAPTVFGQVIIPSTDTTTKEIQAALKALEEKKRSITERTPLPDDGDSKKINCG